MLRGLNTFALLATSWAWATLLVVGGLSLAVSPPSGLGPWKSASVTLAGLAGVAAGFFVFEVIVADRVFPRARRPMTLSVEIIAGALMLIFTGAAVFVALSGA
jgi:hypothetical protein